MVTVSWPVGGVPTVRSHGEEFEFEHVDLLDPEGGRGAFVLLLAGVVDRLSQQAR